MITIWPFLVSRNAFLDYMPIVAPQFMIDLGVDGLLVLETSNYDSEKFVRRYIKTPKIGSLTLIFHTVPATDGHTTIIKDKLGRRISWVEGIIIKGKSREGISEEVFNQARSQISTNYNNFWRLGKEAKVISSTPIYVVVESRVFQLAPKKEQVLFSRGSIGDLESTGTGKSQVARDEINNVNEIIDSSTEGITRPGHFQMESKRETEGKRKRRKSILVTATALVSIAVVLVNQIRRNESAESDVNVMISTVQALQKEINLLEATLESSSQEQINIGEENIIQGTIEALQDRINLLEGTLESYTSEHNNQTSTSTPIPEDRKNTPGIFNNPSPINPKVAGTPESGSFP